MSANSKRKTKAHDILFAKSNRVVKVKTETAPPKSNEADELQNVDKTHVFHDPVSGISFGFAPELMANSFFDDLSSKLDENAKSAKKKKGKSVFDDEDDEGLTQQDRNDAGLIHAMALESAKQKPSTAKAKYNLFGRDVDIDGFTQKEVDELMAEMQADDAEESEDITEEDLKRLGLTREELDSNTAKRVDMPRNPVVGQTPIPAPGQITYDCDLPGYRFSTLTSEVPFPLSSSDQPFSLRVCVVGTPNAGKSVFVNAMTRVKVTAVSPKRNTTRRQTIGVATEANTQVVLFDTPGINEIHAAKNYQRDLATEAWDAVGDADLVLVVMDAAKRIGGPELFLLHKCKEVSESNPNIKWVLVLNKVDLVEPKEELVTYLNRTLALFPQIQDCFMISSLTGDGVADIENYLFNSAIPREWEHEEETRTDQTEVQHATEIIREALYNRLNQEIPYAVQQQNIAFEVLRNGDLRIDQRIVVRKEQHKEILTGLNGKALRSIIQTATVNLQNAFGRKVHLYMRVNVNQNQDFKDF